MPRLYRVAIRSGKRKAMEADEVRRFCVDGL
jgi:hypothetical protein